MRANILEFNVAAHSVVGDVLVDIETPVVTLSISKICRLSLPIQDIHRVRICVCVFIGVIVRAL